MGGEGGPHISQQPRLVLVSLLLILNASPPLQLLLRQVPNVITQGEFAASPRTVGTGHSGCVANPTGELLLCPETPNLLGSVQQVLSEHLECAKVD